MSWKASFVYHESGLHGYTSAENGGGEMYNGYMHENAYLVIPPEFVDSVAVRDGVLTVKTVDSELLPRLIRLDVSCLLFIEICEYYGVYMGVKGGQASYEFEQSLTSLNNPTHEKEL